MEGSLENPSGRTSACDGEVHDMSTFGVAARPGLRGVAAAVLVVLLGSAGVAAAQEPHPETFTRHTELAREYWLYQPPGYDHDDEEQPALPLVVYLHGCNQTAPDVAVGTRWNELAAREGLFVAYPEQSPAANGTQCWNWFLPEHQRRGAGEPSIVVAITEAVMATRKIDPSRVYVIGASAGADMATILGAAYPDRFAAIGVLAGCAYQTCADVTGDAALAAMGEHARSMPVFAVQGTADAVNNLALGQGMVQQWLGTNDLADDGEANHSVSRLPASREHTVPQGTPVPGSGDPCIGNARFPCLGGVLGLQEAYPTTVEHYLDAVGRTLVEVWLVHGLGHAYPAGNPEGSFTDPLGPDVTTGAWAFFQDHPLPG